MAFSAESIACQSCLKYAVCPSFPDFASILIEPATSTRVVAVGDSDSEAEMKICRCRGAMTEEDVVEEGEDGGAKVRVRSVDRIRPDDSESE